MKTWIWGKNAEHYLNFNTCQKAVPVAHHLESRLASFFPWVEDQFVSLKLHPFFHKMCIIHLSFITWLFWWVLLGIMKLLIITMRLKWDHLLWCFSIWSSQVILFFIFRNAGWISLLIHPHSHSLIGAAWYIVFVKYVYIVEVTLFRERVLGHPLGWSLSFFI